MHKLSPIFDLPPLRDRRILQRHLRTEGRSLFSVSAANYSEFSIRPAFVRWLGVGLGTKTGNVSLFGEIKVSFTFGRLRERFESRPDKINSKEIKGIDLTHESIRDLLGPPMNRHRPHMEVALVLSVWRRCPKMKIETKRLGRQDNKAPMKEKPKIAAKAQSRRMAVSV